ncbi:MAG: VanZ family protein [Candidatus Thiodiazotropha sp.]
MAADWRDSLDRNQSTLLRVALAFSLIAISYLAFTPLEIPVASSLNDKFSHILAFLYLGLLWDFCWPESKWSYRKALPMLGYGLFIEVVQAFLPHRFFSLLDLAADGLGLILCGLILPWLLRSQWISSLRHQTK